MESEEWKRASRELLLSSSSYATILCLGKKQEEGEEVKEQESSHSAKAAPRLSPPHLHPGPAGPSSRPPQVRWTATELITTTRGSNNQ